MHASDWVFVYILLQTKINLKPTPHFTLWFLRPTVEFV